MTRTKRNQAPYIHINIKHNVRVIFQSCQLPQASLRLLPMPTHSPAPDEGEGGKGRESHKRRRGTCRRRKCGHEYGHEWIVRRRRDIFLPILPSSPVPSIPILPPSLPLPSLPSRPPYPSPSAPSSPPTPTCPMSPPRHTRPPTAAATCWPRTSKIEGELLPAHVGLVSWKPKYRS